MSVTPIPASAQRRHDFLDSIRIFLDLHRNEGMTDDEIRDGLRQQLRIMNEAQEDAA